MLNTLKNTVTQASLVYSDDNQKNRDPYEDRYIAKRAREHFICNPATLLEMGIKL